MKARVRPSANCTRRTINSSSPVMSFAESTRRAGWALPRSKAAMTEPCSAPSRTSAASPRAPSASAKASSNIDFPAPVSPVSTARPDPKSMSRRSIRTISRMESRASMTTTLVQDGGILPIPGPSVPIRQSAVLRAGQAHFLERFADPGLLVLGRLPARNHHQPVRVFVPLAVREIVAQHRGGRLRFIHQTDRDVSFGQSLERFFDVTRRLILRHHHLEPVDGANEVALLHVVAPDLHLLAGQLVARHVDFLARGGGIFGFRILAHDFFERVDRFVGTRLISADVENLVVIR